MDTTNSNLAKFEVMVSEIAEKLRMVNVGVLRVESLSEDAKEDLIYLHEMVMGRDNFSIGEMDAIATELGIILKSK